MAQKFKVMAYFRSTGLWDHCHQVKLHMTIANVDAMLIEDLATWQADYDAQFQKFTYEFDWDAFNQRGCDLAERIQEIAAGDALVCYVESDDRHFFSPEDCLKTQMQQ